MAEPTDDGERSEPPPPSTRRRRAKQRRRRRVATGIAAVLLVAAGAGTAWAERGTGGPRYRLATVQTADVSQTVDADGTLSAKRSAALAFATGGTVDSVRVAVGQTVSAGQVLATVGTADLVANRTSAVTALAQARQKLTDDEDGQTSTASSTQNTKSPSTTSNTSGITTSTASFRSLTSSAAAVPSATPAPTTSTAPTAPTTHPTTQPAPGSTTSSVPAAVAAVRKAQAAVVAAQSALDQAVSRQDAAVTELSAACAPKAESTAATTSVIADTDGTVTGAAGASAVVVSVRNAGGTALATTTTPNPETVAAGHVYSFSGLRPGERYTLQVLRSAVIATDACSAAVQTVVADQKGVDAGVTKLETSLTALDRAVETLQSAAAGTGGTGSTSSGPTKPTGGTSTTSRSAPSGSKPSASTPSGSARSRTGRSGSAQSGSAQSGSAQSGTAQSGTARSGTSGTTSSGTSTTTAVTSQQIAADQKAIDAAKAALAVATYDVSLATLRATMSGKVAAVGLAKADAVDAGSSSKTVTVVGSGALTVDLGVSLADIDLVKVGQSAAVTVDGQQRALPAHVVYVGSTNTSSSTGSASQYTVTVQLTASYRSLYDGMGTSVAIAVGAARGVVTVPISAVQTTGSQHTVSVSSGGTPTTQRVTLGVVGTDRVQITSGLRAGQQVVLADLRAAVPTTSTNSNRRGTTTGSFGGLTGAGAGRGGPPGAGPR